MCTKHNADDERAQRHPSPRREAPQTGQTEAEVMEANFKKPMERKKLRVERYKEAVEKHSQEWKAPSKDGKRKA